MAALPLGPSNHTNCSSGHFWAPLLRSSQGTHHDQEKCCRAERGWFCVQMQELNLVEADQTTMKKIAGRMPGLTTLKEDLNEAAGKPRKSGKGSK